ncbi:hypothetical protein GF322_00940 [Candidatus Dependentiae bacterium]|nr:hypothetical protein [Candidatus Dependentiae bacterium]
MVMDYILLRYFFSFIFSTLLAIYLIPVLIKTAFKFNILDVPDGKIKKHQKAVPYLGGVSIYIPFIATLSIVYPFENQILWLFLGISLLLFVGLIDDLKILKPLQKLFGQILAVICFLKGGFSLKTNFFVVIFNVFLSGFWMLSVINAFNLVDVMDGLATVLAIIAGVSFLIISLILNLPSITILILSFLGPLFVYFFYNRPPAKIYLGDAGSMYVGGFLAAIPLLFPWSSCFFNAYYTPVIILGIPLLEVFSLVIIRTYLGIPFYKGSPHHFAIYLRNKGWSIIQVLIFTIIMSSILSAGAILFLFQFINFNLLIILGILFLLIWFYFIFLKKH